MEFFGTRFSLTLGSWRLRFVLSLEEADDEFVERAGQARPHHLRSARRLSHVR